MITIEEARKIPQVSILMNIIELFNIDVYKHCMSVAEMTAKILLHTDKFTEQEKDDIIVGAMLHDIGKILVPFNLAEAPRRLSDNEFEIIKIHTRIGYEILKNDFPEIVSNIALYHHERPDRSGYNEAIPLSKIPKEALLVQVTDIFDALVSERRYKTKYDPISAISIMKNDSKNYKIDDTYYELLKDELKEEGLI